MLDEVHLRRAEARDRSMLLGLYAADRASAYASLRLSELQLTALLEEQLRVRDAVYAKRFPGAEQWVAVVNGRDVGHIFMHASAGLVRVLEFAIAGDERRRGYGEGAMRAVQQLAERSGCDVTLRVRRQSAASRLYLRLGFFVVAGREHHDEMRWARPATRADIHASPPTLHEKS